MITGGALGHVCLVSIFYNIHHPEAVASRYPGVIRQIMTHHAYTSLFLTGETPRPSLACARPSQSPGDTADTVYRDTAAIQQ
eukprot:6181082-Prymnesium_polylepis.1